ncbi:hypothetical protein GWK47_032936 [Chionoecetes opilio]|uniref:Uncharacterized protein n=1 Tax=Chionoecetes opilio TaxID=41210 RepID=A0A8J4YPX3_CHIOP|nr:hypothetical protein GWK47_032936 [Chionoecetes opilio]
MAAILRWSRVPKRPRLPPLPHLATLHHAQQAPSSRAAPLLLAPPAPAFAPGRATLSCCFGTNHVAIKLRWLSEVNGAFHLDRDQAEVKRLPLTSRSSTSPAPPDIVTRRNKRRSFIPSSRESKTHRNKPRKFLHTSLTPFTLSDSAQPCQRSCRAVY